MIDPKEYVGELIDSSNLSAEETRLALQRFVERSEYNSRVLAVHAEIGAVRQEISDARIDLGSALNTGDLNRRTSDPITHPETHFLILFRIKYDLLWVFIGEL
jgi:hypothetical protein